MFALTFLAYNFKFLWAPLVDSVRIPLLGGFGQRRSWLWVTGAIVMAAVVLLGSLDPQQALTTVALAAVLVGVAGATFDIVIDAYRIELMIRIAFEVDAIQDRTNHARVRRLQLVNRFARRLTAGLVRADDEDHARRPVGDDGRVGHGQHRRRVDDHPVEVLTQRRDVVLEALGTEELGRIRRNHAGRKHPQSVDGLHLRTASLALQSPTSRFDNPGSCGRSKISWTRGRRMSASISSTRWPACASAIARLLDTTLLPSPGPALVTTTMRALFGRREQHVGPNRPDRLGEVRRDAFGDQRLVLVGNRRHHPEERHARRARSSCGDLMRLSRYSKKNTRPTATRRPESPASEMSRSRRGRNGDFGTSAASTTRMVLALNSPEMPVSFVRCSSDS